MEKKEKHILLLNRSFWPDMEATGQFLTELCEQLAKKYKVTAIAGRSYCGKKETFPAAKFYNKEVFKGVEIIRVRHTRFWKGNLVCRIINWITYCMLAFIAALKIKPNIIIVCTDPPFISIIAMVVSWIKSSFFIVNCQDLYPDVVLGLGQLRPGLLSNSFDYVNKRVFHKAFCIVCLGKSMKNRLLLKGFPNELIKTIPLWADTQLIRPIQKVNNPFLKKMGIKDKFVIMYSGNFGFSHEFSSILQALCLIKERISFYVIFIGEGVGKIKLRREAQLLGLKNITFLPYQPKESLSFSLSAADLHLVPLKKGLEGAIVPSKIYGIMAAGRPYLAVTGRESEPARLVEEFGCGLWAPPDDIERIATVLEWAYNNRDKLSEMGKKGRKITEEKFDKNTVIKEWFKLLDGIFKVEK